MQATVVERAAVEGGDIGAAAGRHIAGLVDLAVVVPATFAVQDPQRAARGGANAGFGDSINRDGDGRFFSRRKRGHDAERAAGPPLLSSRSNELHDPVARDSVDVTEAAFKERRIRLVFGGGNGVRGEVVRKDHDGLEVRLDLQVVPSGVRGVVVGPRVTAKFKNDFGERKLDFDADYPIEDKFHRLAVGDHLHPVEQAVVKSASIESGDVRAAARGHIAGLVDLAVVVPATFAAHVSEEHVFIFRFVENPQRTARGRADARFGDAVDGRRNRRVFRGIECRHDPQCPP